MNRRGLLGGIATALFGTQLPVAARDDNLAASPISWKSGKLDFYTPLKWHSGVIANRASSEVFLKNNLQPIINSVDASIISANRAEYNLFGVSIYADCSGIFTNEIKDRV